MCEWVTWPQGTVAAERPPREPRAPREDRVCANALPLSAFAFPHRRALDVCVSEFPPIWLMYIRMSSRPFGLCISECRPPARIAPRARTGCDSIRECTARISCLLSYGFPNVWQAPREDRPRRARRVDGACAGPSPPLSCAVVHGRVQAAHPRPRRAAAATAPLSSSATCPGAWGRGRCSNLFPLAALVRGEFYVF